MSRRKKRKAKVPKTGAVWHLSAEEATMLAKPRYNGFACGHGPHGTAKYDRARSKRAWKQDLQQQRAPKRGSLPFWLRFAYSYVLKCPLSCV